MHEKALNEYGTLVAKKILPICPGDVIVYLDTMYTVVASSVQTCESDARAVQKPGQYSAVFYNDTSGSLIVENGFIGNIWISWSIFTSDCRSYSPATAKICRNGEWL